MQKCCWAACGVRTLNRENQHPHQLPRRDARGGGGGGGGGNSGRRSRRAALRPLAGPHSQKDWGISGIDSKLNICPPSVEGSLRGCFKFWHVARCVLWKFGGWSQCRPLFDDGWRTMAVIRERCWRGRPMTGRVKKCRELLSGSFGKPSSCDCKRLNAFGPHLIA